MDATMDAVTTAVSGSSYYFSSVVMVLVSETAVAAQTTADAQTTVDAAHGITAAETLAETTVAANLFGNGLGGIFGCPSCHDSNPSFLETLKLFLPYFPLHIQNLIHMYLKLMEFMHTFELIQNMMNHMDQYQSVFKMFNNDSFTMPDFGSMQNMMEGSSLVDEFTYVEEPSGTGRNGS